MRIVEKPRLNAVVVCEIYASTSGKVRFINYPERSVISWLRNPVAIEECEISASWLAGIARELAALPLDYDSKKKNCINFLNETKFIGRSPMPRLSEKEEGYLVARVLYGSPTHKVRLVFADDAFFWCNDSERMEKCIDALRKAYLLTLNGVPKREKKMLIEKTCKNIEDEFEIYCTTLKNREKYAQRGLFSNDLVELRF